MTQLSKKEGKKIKNLPPMAKVSPFIMVSRQDASNRLQDVVRAEAAEEYIRRKKAEGLTGFNMMHVLMAAYVRTVSQRPGINRFLRGQRVYRRNGIEALIAVKKEMSLESPDTCIKIALAPTDTAQDVYEAFEKEIRDYREEPAGAFDSAAKAFNYIPALLMKFVVWLLKILDYLGWLPRFLTKLSPFHGSIFVTSMGSLGVPAIYHHLYDFGNLPIFLAFGTKRKTYEMRPDGSVEECHYIDYTITMDERICDGYYYASAIKMFKYYLRHPDLLDVPPETVVDDIY